jgi:hypothetical protein
MNSAYNHYLQTVKHFLHFVTSTFSLKHKVLCMRPLCHELRAVHVEIAERSNLIYPFFGLISIAVNSQKQGTEAFDIYTHTHSLSLSLSLCDRHVLTARHRTQVAANTLKQRCAHNRRKLSGDWRNNYSMPAKSGPCGTALSRKAS